MKPNSDPQDRIVYPIHKLMIDSYEPRREKTSFLHMRKTKTQISFAVTAKLISAFIFATRIVQSLYFLNTKFQASSHLLWLYSLVGPGRKPRGPVFSQRGSYNLTLSKATKIGFLQMRLKCLLGSANRHIRILHECEVLIAKCVARVTVWHHEARPSDAKLWPKG